MLDSGVDKKEVVSYTKAEMNALLSATKDTPNGARTRALVCMMWRCGLRISEALMVRWADVGASELFVAHGKGGHTRKVPVLPETRGMFRDWMHERSRFLEDNEGPMFCSIAKASIGQPIDRRNFFRTLANIGRKAGISKRVHPHGIRHTYALDLHRSGLPLEVIRRFLGHQSLDATRDYLVCITGEDASAAYFAAAEEAITY